VAVKRSALDAGLEPIVRREDRTLASAPKRVAAELRSWGEFGSAGSFLDQACRRIFNVVKHGQRIVMNLAKRLGLRGKTMIAHGTAPQCQAFLRSVRASGTCRNATIRDAGVSAADAPAGVLVLPDFGCEKYRTSCADDRRRTPRISTSVVQRE
jgi:hypothetical protein